MDTQQQKTNWAIPLAIVIAGGLIAFSLYYVKKDNSAQVATIKTTQDVHPEENMLPVTSADHILGNPNAPVMLVEYSDTDCPYCQTFQPSLHKIINTLGKDGQVAWVYRHFAFHPNAPKEAEATECVAELGGNEKFWQFLDLLFSKKNFKQDPYVGIQASTLPSLAASIGIDKAQFTTCLNSGKYTEKIKTDYQNAIKAGAEGTPYTIIVTKGGKVPIKNGAIPYNQLEGAVKALINNPQ